MGFILLPLIVLSFFFGITAIEDSRTQGLLPTAAVTQADQSGQMFVTYCNAVSIYQQNNPAFTGTVSDAALAAQGGQFSPAFLVVANNAITAISGGAGRVITCYAALSADAIAVALDVTDHDASIGIVSGASWTSFAKVINYTPVPVPVPLATPVPSGNVVSVIQIGS